MRKLPVCAKFHFLTFIMGKRVEDKWKNGLKLVVISEKVFQSILALGEVWRVARLDFYGVFV